MEITESDHTTPAPKDLPDDFFIGDDDYDAIVSGPPTTQPAGEKRSAKMPHSDAERDLQDRIETVIDEFDIPSRIRVLISERLSEAIATELGAARKM